MDNGLKRSIILDHYQSPRNKGLIDDSTYIRINMNNESCIDEINLMVKLDDNKIKDIRFDGEACAISTSATSIMIRSLIGKSLEDAKNIISNYKKMINEEEYDATLLGELNVYDEICKQPNRKNCALIPEKALEQLLEVVGNGKN